MMRKINIFSTGLSGIDFSSIRVPGAAASGTRPPIAVQAEDDPATVRNMFHQNPDQLALLKQNNPRLADALLSGNLGKFLCIIIYEIVELLMDVLQIRFICNGATGTNSCTTGTTTTTGAYDAGGSIRS